MAAAGSYGDTGGETELSELRGEREGWEEEEVANSPPAPSVGGPAALCRWSDSLVGERSGGPPLVLPLLPINIFSTLTHK